MELTAEDDDEGDDDGDGEPLVLTIRDSGGSDWVMDGTSGV